jgi:hypothetical protein
LHVLFFGNDPPATLGVALRAGKQNLIFIHFVFRGYLVFYSG